MHPVDWYIRRWEEREMYGVTDPESRPFDLPLFRKTLEWVRDEAARPIDEREWYQGSWTVAGELIGRSCGTAYCFAGYVTHLAGYTIETGTESIVVTDRGRETIPVVADRLLGLTNAESDDLYMSSNSLAAIEIMAEAIVKRRGLAL